MARHALIFGIGVDIAHVPRFQRCLERHGERFLRRAYHPQEIAELRARPPAQHALFLASRWAAKEAAFKAFQRYRVLFPEMCVGRKRVNDDASCTARIRTALPVTTDSKTLELEFCGETAALAVALRLLPAHVSISHDGDYAMAAVVLEQELGQSTTSDILM